MCGRFVLFTTDESLLTAVGSLFSGARAVVAPEGTPGPRYNIAPTQVIPVVRMPAPENNEVLLEPARWGLLPHWKKDLDGPPLFNARAETVASKPSFRDAFKGQRCVIPLDGYYEWKDKVPHFVRRDDGELMWAAGLWATGVGRLSATMVTTAAPEPMSQLHDRLPRFLETSEVERWLLGSAEQAAEMLDPAPAQLVEHFVISEADKAVGNVRNDYPGLIGK